MVPMLPFSPRDPGRPLGPGIPVSPFCPASPPKPWIKRYKKNQIKMMKVKHKGNQCGHFDYFGLSDINVNWKKKSFWT